MSPVKSLHRLLAKAFGVKALKRCRLRQGYGVPRKRKAGLFFNRNLRFKVLLKFATRFVCPICEARG